VTEEPSPVTPVTQITLKRARGKDESEELDVRGEEVKARR